MPSPRAPNLIVWLSPWMVLAACSSRGSGYCPWCDAGVDRAVDRPIGPPPADAHSATADARQRQPADAPAIDIAPAEIRDAVPGELPGQTEIPDGGYLYVEDFAGGDANGWQVLHWIDAGAPNPDWSAATADGGSVYAEESLDTTDWHISYTMRASSSDQIAEASMRVVDFYAKAPSYAAALFGRYHPVTDSGYLVALRGDGSLVIRRRDHGVMASWDGGVDVGIEPGVWYTVRLEVLGGVINAYLNGVFVCGVTDTDPLPAGGVALGTFGATLEVDRVLLAAP